MNQKGMKMKDTKLMEAIGLLKRAVGLLECALCDAEPAGVVACSEYEAKQMPTPKKQKPTVAVQPDLFDPSQFEAGRKAVERKAAAERAKARAKASFRKRGTPGIGKSQALKNFREIAGSKELLTLSEVNRIFGYNESTHGRFVKDAIKSGKLPAVKYGEKRKFVAREVRRFIDDYYKMA